MTRVSKYPTQDHGYHGAPVLDALQEVVEEAKLVRLEYAGFADVMKEFKESDFMKEIRDYTQLDIKVGIL